MVKINAIKTSKAGVIKSIRMIERPDWAYRWQMIVCYCMGENDEHFGSVEGIGDHLDFEYGLKSLGITAEEFLLCLK